MNMKAINRFLKVKVCALGIVMMFWGVSMSWADQETVESDRSGKSSSINEFKKKAISVLDLGTITIFPDQSWRFPGGPKGTRSVTSFKGAEWVGYGIHAKALWGNGSYTASPEGIVEVNVRFLFKTDDDALIYLDYVARFDWEEQESGEVSGPVMTGRIETNAERYAWLNKTQVIGKGSFEDGKGDRTMQMQYRLYALPNSKSPVFE